MTTTIDSVRDYYDSDEVIGYFLADDFFDRLVWHTQFEVVDERGERIDETGFLIRWAGAAPGQRVLDFGCGAGNLCLKLAERGVLAHGVNISPRQVEIGREEARQRGLETASFDVYDGQRLPYAAAWFDAVLFQESMCHVIDKPAIFAEIRRVLKLGGVLAGQDWFAKGPDPAPLVARIDAHFRSSLATMERYVEIAAAAGFGAVETIDCADLPGCAWRKPFEGPGVFQKALEQGAFTVGFFRAVAPAEPASGTTAG